MLLILLTMLLAQEPAPVDMESLLERTEAYRVSQPASKRELRRVGRDLRKRAEKQKELREELAQSRNDAAAREIASLNEENTRALKSYAESYGWFPRSVWDWRPGWNGWLLIQQADSDPVFQARVLATMGPLVERGEIGIKNYAYLYDRVARNHDLPQRYATEGRCISPGIWEPLPLEDPLEVDSLRNDAGLEPLEDYALYEAEKCR